MDDCLIVGGGVVGLSLAYELARHGLGVHVIDAQQPGRESSWAGAGIMPPGPPEPHGALEELFALSNRLHREWAESFQGQTGIDNGYRVCGALYVARHGEATLSLDASAEYWRDRKIRFQALSQDELSQCEPALKSSTAHAAYLLPDEYQIRNPRHVRALVAVCQKHGVRISADTPALGFDFQNRLVAVETPAGMLRAANVCVTSGAWTARLMAQLGVQLAIRPIRGQIALVATERPLLSHIVNEGCQYLVPRPDGNMLVGSTLEDVGFDRSTTDEAIDVLLRFLWNVVPSLNGVMPERTWAGLRPHAGDGMPYLGRVPDFDNLFVAAGHYRSGLQLSPGTAVVMSQLIRGEAPRIDLEPFRLDRHLAVPS